MAETFQIQERVTLLPIVSNIQHGPNRQFCLRQKHDEKGQLIWVKDARGYLTYREYDGATGALKRLIQDADPTLIEAPVVSPPANDIARLPGPRLHLIMDYEIDALGRTTKVLGPAHAVQLQEADTTTTLVRRCEFRIFRCIFHERWNAVGYAVGVGPTYNYFTEGLLQITKLDGEGRVLEEIGTLRASNTGAPANDETFPRERWKRWRTIQLDTWGRPSSDRTYHLIPSDGDGEEVTHYLQTSYEYDEMGRVVATKDSSGNILRNVFDYRGLRLSTWAGTNDVGATAQFPDGGTGGPPENNMLKTDTYEYNASDDLFRHTSHVNDDAAQDRVTEYDYDFRMRLKRQTEVDAWDDHGVTPSQKRDLYTDYTYDNLDQALDVTRLRESATTPVSLSRLTRFYDVMGRVFQEDLHGENAVTGGVTENALTMSSWFDAAGNLVALNTPGSQAVQKTVYDGIGRATARYLVLPGEGWPNYVDGSSSNSSSSSSSSIPSSSDGGGGGDSSSSSSSESGPPDPPDHSSSTEQPSNSRSDGSDGGSPSDVSGSPSDGGGSSSDHDGSSSSNGGSSSDHDGSPSGGSPSGSTGGEPPPEKSCPDCEQREYEYAAAESCNESKYPVRYSSGQLNFSSIDLSARAFGLSWGHSRCYLNRLSGDRDGIQGQSWVLQEACFIKFGVGEGGSQAVVIRGGNDNLWFQPDGHGGWQSLFGGREQLFDVPSSVEIHLLLASGLTNVFFGMSAAPSLRGKLRALIQPGGRRVDLAYNTDGQMIQFAQTVSCESSVFDYTYYGAGARPGSVGRLASVTKKTNGTVAEHVEYAYYSDGDLYGSHGDLKLARSMQWSSTYGAWRETSVEYYRYYTNNDAGGFLHGLKTVVGAEGWRRIQAEALDAETLTDVRLLPFTDHLLTYDNNFRVITEKTRGGEDIYDFTYTANPNGPPLSAKNVWATKTTESLPDGGQNIIYSNLSGQQLLYIAEAPPVTGGGTPSRHYRHYVYNDEGRLTENRTNAAIAAVTEPDVGNSFVLDVELHTDQGLVNVYGYYDTSSPDSREVQGYLNGLGVREGSAGTPQLRTSLKYQSATMDGKTIRRVRRRESRISDQPTVGLPTESWTYVDNFFGVNPENPPVQNTETDLLNDVTSDTVFEQVKVSFDAGSNPLLMEAHQRFHNATGTGALHGPSEIQPQSRRSYAAAWPDGIGRVRASANYGTNGGELLTRPDVAPPASDTILISLQRFNAVGEREATIDPLGTETRWEYDQAGRTRATLENVRNGVVDNDANRVTRYAYHTSGQIQRLTWENFTTGNQVTEWIFGTTASDGLATGSLLKSKRYADGTRHQWSYNRQGEAVSYTDANGNIHAYEFDQRGRLLQDRVETLGERIDGLVRRISYRYDPQSRLTQVSSWNNPAPDEGDIVNQSSFEYDDFGNLTSDWQSHNGEVTGSTPRVQYAYDNAAKNQTRRTALIYPNSRQVDVGYGLMETDDDKLSRVQTLIFPGDGLGFVSYEYMGGGNVILTAYPQISVNNSLFQPAVTGDAGDLYTSLDRFGRLENVKWDRSSTSSVIEHVLYGYNRASNCTWRDVLTPLAGTTTPVADWDERYSYDGLYQVIHRQRGNLNLARTAINGTPVREEFWAYDSAGNWQAYTTKATGSIVQDQRRVNNQLNQIGSLATTLGSLWNPETDPLASDRVEHDSNGNILLLPHGPTGEWDQALQLTWDAWNRLVQVQNVSDSNLIATYQYDGLWRRIMKAISTETRHYYYNDQWRSIEEHIEGISDTRIVEQQHFWGVHNRWEYHRRDRNTDPGSDSTLDEVLYALKDAMNVTAICHDSADVVERYQYSAFGQRLVLDPDNITRGESEFQWNLGFHVEFDDVTTTIKPDTGLSNYGYRYYDALLGRWAGRDLGSVNDGSNNQDAFLNRPQSLIDYLGGNPDPLPPAFDNVSTLFPGPYADKYISGSNTLDFSQNTRRNVNSLGVCHHCGTSINGYVMNMMSPDHQPPRYVERYFGDPTYDYRYYPHCKQCQIKQWHQSSAASKSPYFRWNSPPLPQISTNTPCSQTTAGKATNAAAGLIYLADTYLMPYLQAQAEARLTEKALEECKSQKGSYSGDGCCEISLFRYYGNAGGISPMDQLLMRIFPCHKPASAAPSDPKNIINASGHFHRTCCSQVTSRRDYIYDSMDGHLQQEPGGILINI